MTRLNYFLARFALSASAIALRAADPTAMPPPPSPITVSTAHSSLSLLILGDGRVYQLGYGERNAAPGLPQLALRRESEFHPQYGDGYILEPAIQATHADGNTSTDLIHLSHESQDLDTNVSLTRIELKDSYYPFFVTLFLKSYRNEDVIEQWCQIHHDEPGPVTLERFASSAPLFQAKEYWLSQFQGDYQREATLAEAKLATGLAILDSKIGVRASRFRIPSFLLSLDGPAAENSGQVYGGSLEWSGSFQLAFDLDWNNRLRALCGINPFGEQLRLKPAQLFTTPAMLWTWSGRGKGQVSRNFHHWALRYGIRDPGQPRPVLLNNWEATGFDFDENKIVSLFDAAKEIGVEVFLLDDGWFGNRYPRNNDRAGLGDWQVNTNKLPRGLAFLADEAARRGLKFGAWIEPEMVNPRSDLSQAHPEWAIQQPHRKWELSRNQLDLDLSRPAVQDFVWSVVDNVLATPGLTFTKWDANRYVTQPGSAYLPPDRQSELLIDYNFALYDLMARMAKKYPRVMAMACSGGGGRADYGALRYFHSFWPSDNTDPSHRVFIQWGFSQFFPAASLACHVTRMGKRPLKFTLDVAMSGALGVDMDLSKTTPEERQLLKDSIRLYKEDLREVVQQGDLYRLQSPYDGPRAALDYVTADRARAVLLVYQLKDDTSPGIVRPEGLDPQGRYAVREVGLPPGAPSRLAANGQTMDGSALMRDGLPPPCQHEFDSAVILLTEEK